MRRNQTVEILNRIDPALVEECASYRPPLERNGMKKIHRRRVAVLILAACLAVALAVTAYATGAIQSLIARYWGNIVYRTPDQQLREERPDYAQWLDTQLETQAMMQHIGEQAVQTDVSYRIPGLQGAGVTLLEYYYDGEKLSLACQVHRPEKPVVFAQDISIQAEAEDWCPPYESIVRNPADLQAIAYRKKAEGSVSFLAMDAWIGDHVYVNGENLGPSLGDPDNNGIFIIDPIFMGTGEVALPEGCRNLPQITVRLTYRVALYAYQSEAESLECAKVGQADFPVYFTIPNLNPEGIPARWSLEESALTGGELHLSERIRGISISIDTELPAVIPEALAGITLEADPALWQTMGRELVMERFPQIEGELSAGTTDIGLSDEKTGRLLLGYHLSRDGMAGYVDYLDVERDLNGSSLDGDGTWFLPHYVTSSIPDGMAVTAEEACAEVRTLLERYSCFRFTPWNIRGEFDHQKQQGCYRITLQPEYEGVPLYGLHTDMEAFYSNDGLFLCQGLMMLKESQRRAIPSPLPLKDAIEAFVNTIPELTTRDQVQCTAIRQGYLASVQEEAVTLSPAWVFECSGSQSGSEQGYASYFQIPVLMENGKIRTMHNGQEILLDPA